MPLSRREIHTRATRFAKQWADAHNEEADAKPFWVEFFNVFAFRRYEDASLRAHSMSTTCPAQRDARDLSRLGGMPTHPMKPRRAHLPIRLQQARRCRAFHVHMPA